MAMLAPAPTKKEHFIIQTLQASIRRKWIHRERSSFKSEKEEMQHHTNIAVCEFL